MVQDPAPDASIPADIQSLSFEQALAALDEIVRRLEGGQVDLEESIAIYTRGRQLKQHCEAKLQAASEKVEKIMLGSNGAVAAEPFDVD